MKSDFAKNGKEFVWIRKSTLSNESGIITYDEQTKSYLLKEKFRNYVEPFYYSGKETEEGFHFYELTGENGGIKENGNQVLIRPLEPGIFNIEHFYHYLGSGSPKRWIPSRYYSKNLRDAQLDRLVRGEIRKLEFLSGKYVSEDSKREFTGRIADDGKTFLWNFTSPEKISEAVVTYDYHWDEFTFTEKIRSADGEKITHKYSGRISENGIPFYSRIDGKMTSLTFSSPKKDRIVVKLMIYGGGAVAETIYRKVP
ncbi:MAG: hypothetical protein R2681_02065 [Pyrinomonadaceae bacterium]